MSTVSRLYRIPALTMLLITAASCDFANYCIGPQCDQDGDGHGPLQFEGDDCDDQNPAAHPGLLEDCNDEIDNNCDGRINEGCTCAKEGDLQIGAADALGRIVPIDPANPPSCTTSRRTCANHKWSDWFSESCVAGAGVCQNSALRTCDDPHLPSACPAKPAWERHDEAFHLELGPNGSPDWNCDGENEFACFNIDRAGHLSNERKVGSKDCQVSGKVTMLACNQVCLGKCSGENSEVHLRVVDVGPDCGKKILKLCDCVFNGTTCMLKGEIDGTALTTPEVIGCR